VARVKQDLTAAQKIEVIKGAQKLLGAKGQNWIKGAWFGRKTTNFVPGKGRYIRDPKDNQVLNWEDTSPGQANCWCALGALEESAFRLGYSERRRKSGVVGKLTSVAKVAKSRLTEFMNGNHDPVYTLNDYSKTEWKDIKKLLSDRIKELEKEG
jgi:hypothetical protein